MSKNVLVVVHQESSTWGKVGQLLIDRGFHLDRRCPCMGDPLPEHMDEHDACVVFGGPQSANDDDNPGIRAELDWLETCGLRSDKPLLGICLGAQEIARVLGAKVGPHPDGLVEIGYTEVLPTESAEDFLPEATVFYQWHSETFGIPHGAVHLARNEAFAGQAFRYGKAVHAIEFHPEMTREMVQKWCTSDGGSRKLGWRGAQGYEEQMAGYDRHASGSDAWLRGFIDGIFVAACD